MFEFARSAGPPSADSHWSGGRDRRLRQHEGCGAFSGIGWGPSRDCEPLGDSHPLRRWSRTLPSRPHAGPATRPHSDQHRGGGYLRLVRSLARAPMGSVGSGHRTVPGFTGESEKLLAGAACASGVSWRFARTVYRQGPTRRGRSRPAAPLVTKRCDWPGQRHAHQCDLCRWSSVDRSFGCSTCGRPALRCSAA
jgi:hypothetical protein